MQNISGVSPAHSSQGPQGFKQEGTGVQGRQAAGSPTVSLVQLPTPPEIDPIHTYLPERAGNSQQPKQSQPFGVNGRQ